MVHVGNSILNSTIGNGRRCVFPILWGNNSNIHSYQTLIMSLLLPVFLNEADNNRSTFICIFLLEVTEAPAHHFKVHVPASGKKENMKCHTMQAGKTEIQFISRMNCELASLRLLSLTSTACKEVICF